MLIFLNLFWKPFLKRKKKFKFYFILILIFTLSLMLVFQFNNKNNQNIQILNSNVAARKIEVTNLQESVDSTYLEKMKYVLEYYEIYDELSLKYEFGELKTVQSISFDYANFLIAGREIENNCSEIILPNFIYRNNEKIDLSIYYNKTINMSYEGNENYFQVKVVGIYDNFNNLDYVFASNKVYEKIDNSNLSVWKYYLIVDKISNVDKVLLETNKVSNSYVLSVSEYNQSQKLIFLNSVLKIIIIFIIVMFLLVFSLLIRNLVYDLKKDISLLRVYGYSNYYIIKNISFIVFILYFISFIISNIILLILSIILDNYFEIILLSFFEQMIILLIGIVVIFISFIISIGRLKHQSIYFLLKN